MTDDDRPIVPYVCVPGDVARDRDATLSIWQGNLGIDSRHGAKFDWFYRNAPYGDPLLQLLRHQPTNSLVGSAAAGPRRMLWQGREIRAGVLVDFAVQARHRSLGPAMILQTELIAAATARFDILYGFPNSKSLPVVKRLGYTTLGAMVRFSFVLRHHAYIARHLPALLARPLGWVFDLLSRRHTRWRLGSSRSYATSWHEFADPRMDELWLRSDHGLGLLTVRDSTFLRWRFDQMPGVAIRYLCIDEPGHNTMVAWFACQREEHVLHVRDFWSINAATGIAPEFIALLITAARPTGVTAISVEYAAPREKQAFWLRAGFTERDRRPAIFRWTGAVADGEVPVDYHLTAADEDE